MRKHETAVCGTARTVVWEVGKCENRRQMPFMISIYLLPDCFYLKSGHEGSKSLRVIFIFKFKKIPVIKVIKVIKDFGFQKYPSTSLYLIK